MWLRLCWLALAAGGGGSGKVHCLQQRKPRSQSRVALDYGSTADDLAQRKPRVARVIVLSACYPGTLRAVHTHPKVFSLLSLSRLAHGGALALCSAARGTRIGRACHARPRDQLPRGPRGPGGLYHKLSCFVTVQPASARRVPGHTTSPIGTNRSRRQVRG